MRSKEELIEAERNAIQIVVSKDNLKQARVKLLSMMADKESFDFEIAEQTYRCYRRPPIIVSRPKLNWKDHTFTRQDVLIGSTIIIRKINKRL